MKNIFFIGIFIGLFHALSAQHQELQEQPKIWQGDSLENGSHQNILSAFKSGKVNGHFKYFFSGIKNKGELSDYYANAIGGGLRFETAKFKNFTMGVSGFYIFDLGSSDLALKDPQSGQSNRYEIGLFDVTNPSETSEINRVEELFLKYQFNNTTLTFGRQLLNTPFINLQDGRMRPTAVEGFWAETKIKDRFKVNLGWIYAVGSRSTSKWYDLEDSFGLYPSGVNESGEKSSFFGNVSTKGAGLMSLNGKLNDLISVQLHDIFVENVLNSLLFQVDLSLLKKDHSQWILALQKIRQDGLGNGGNEILEKSYTTPDHLAKTWGGKLAWKNKIFDFSLNFNRITSDGRYLMPREWGRDPFFTFMPRERNEGFGNVTAFNARANYTLKSYTTTMSASFGYFKLPDPLDFRLNKYGMPSYSQFNLDVRHKFKKLFSGLDVQLLWVSKWNQGNTYENPKYIIHKVDMHLLNVVLNFRF